MAYKKRFARRGVCLFVALFMLCWCVTPAFANVVTQDGLEFTLKTDKESYGTGDSISVSLSVKNTNDSAVTNLDLETTIPDGYELGNDSAAFLHTEKLNAGESLVLNSTFEYLGSGGNPSSSGSEESTAKPGDISTTEQNTPSANSSSSGQSVSAKEAGTQSSSSANRNGIASATKTPSTGDDIASRFLIAALALIGGVILIVVARNKKASKVIALLLCILTVSAYMGVSPSSAEARAATIEHATVDVTVEVDGNPVRIKGEVSYEKPIRYEEESLRNLATDEDAFVAGYDARITFTVEGAGIDSDVLLCDETKTPVGTMRDDGLEGDVSAHDGTFTYVLSTVADEASKIEYCAYAGNARSNAVSIRFFARPTSETVESSQAIINEIHGIESSYADAEGYVDLDKVPAVMGAVTEYVESLYAVGTVIDYEVNDQCIIVQLSNGLVTSFSPNVRDIDSIGSDTAMTIMTCQPCMSMYGANDNMALLDNAARSVAETFDNYSFSQNYDNEQVFLDAIKSFGPNQIILWHGHGGYSEKRHSFLLTGETFDWNAWLWDLGYFLDTLQGRVFENGGRACITSKFIEEYCGNLNNDLVYVAACQSGKDSVLADAFLGKGAKAVVANSETIYTNYNVRMASKTIQCMGTIKGNTSNYYTLAEALDDAKEEFGSNDIVWARAAGVRNIKGQAAEPLIFGGDDARTYRLANKESGTLIGKACMASDRSTPITGASVSVFKGNEAHNSITTNSGGDYRVTLPVGEYRIVVEKEGFVPFTAYVTISNGNDEYVETFLMVEASENGTGSAQGFIHNAITGEGVEGVVLAVREGWNNEDVGDPLTTTTTGTDGSYTLSLPCGNYTLLASKGGYVSNSVNIVVQEGNTENQNGTLMPAIDGDEYRAVLTWGQDPKDLDSHVEGVLLDGSAFHVYYSSKSKHDGDKEVCNLDVDDTTSFGPETVTLKPVTNSAYYYYVYRYSGSGTVATSEAQVKLYQGDRLLKTLNVPTNLGDGDYWNVFAIKDGSLIIKSTITNDKDTSYAG